MTESDFTISFAVRQSPDAVFGAINDVRGWWSGDIEGATDTLGATFIYRYEDVHYSTQTITELASNRLVVWHVDDARLNFTSEPDEWVGTDIKFEILPTDVATEVRFIHKGLRAKLECYEKCAGAWSFYIGDSLRRLIATGAGQPNPVP